ncbi:MAG: hypothetical protein KKA62_00655 [Nanoarchaeota archaeon]|nr:hypothetical protein [Nanoarchaeota archaeon]MBU1976444.1 hypothetical protein [Nanoarchaeota archaeon]
MKKVMVSLAVVVIFIFLVGCIDYKTYQVPKEEEKSDDSSLLAEIAQIEEELGLGEDAKTGNKNTNLEVKEKELENEVVLPDLEAEEAQPAEESVQEVVVDENKWVKLKVKVTDPDNDVINYTFSPPLNEKGEWKTNYGDAGEYLVTLKATDGVHIVEKKIKVVVNRVNVAPVIQALKDLFVKEGQTVKFEPKVTDPNKDAVTVKVSEPLNGGVFVTNHESAGEYKIKVLASDGELESESFFKLVVEDVNVLPEIKNLKDVKVKEGETVTLNLQTSDLDDDTVILKISDPVGDDGVWETTYVDHGEYLITVTADDGKDTVTKKIKLVVEDVNMPPKFEEISLDLN